MRGERQVKRRTVTKKKLELANFEDPQTFQIVDDAKIRK